MPHTPHSFVVAAPLAECESGGPATHLRWLRNSGGCARAQRSFIVVGFWQVRHMPWGLRHAAFFWRLWRRVRRAGTVYALDTLSVGFPAAVVARLRRCRLVVRVPGDYAWEWGQVRKMVSADIESFSCGDGWRDAPWRVRLRAMLQRWVVRSAWKVVVPSRFVARLVRCWGVHSSRIVLIPSHPVEPTPSGNRAALRAVMGVANPLIVAVGRLVPWKHFDDLIRALRIVRRNVPRVRLIVVGEGPEREHLEQVAREEGTAPLVQWAGALPADTTHRYMEAADVVALPSSYEGFSHTLLEAMLVGTPVVASAAGGNTELVRNEVEGVMVPVGDVRKLAAALTKMLTLPPERRAVFAARAQQRARALVAHLSEQDPWTVFEE